MLSALLQPAVQVPDPALNAAVEAALRSSNTIIDQGVLGACLILSLLGNIALVWLLVRVQNLRVQDQLSVAKVAQDMVVTFGTVDHALKDLNDAAKIHNGALQGVTNTLNTMMMGLITRGGSIFQLAPPSQGNGQGSTGGTTP
jgi:tetrahydromethanopterin S-methyltransferase subunit D